MVIWVRSCSRSMLTLTFTWWKQNLRIVSQLEVICDKHCNFSLILAQLKLSRVEWIKATATHIEAMTLTLRLFHVNLHMNFPMVVLKLTIHQCLTSKWDTHGSWCDVSWVKIDGLRFRWFWYHRSGNHQVWGKSGLRIFSWFFRKSLNSIISKESQRRTLCFLLYSATYVAE